MTATTILLGTMLLIAVVGLIYAINLKPESKTSDSN